ncbi:hypothetical protein KSP40_PGU006037 [Platanthera guangdongensis]|uniref:Uncharacterized protein n=1 Tax=Platanthera guangdongensis TaxID=2320717 RepID=A0ABR2M5N0_9ASPA
MRETMPSYSDLVHCVKPQITTNEAIDAHKQQFEGWLKRKWDKVPLSVSETKDERRNNPLQDRGTCQHQDYIPLNIA